MLETHGPRILIALGIVGLFGIITFVVAAVTLGTLNKRLNVIEDKLSTPTTANQLPSTTTPNQLSSTTTTSEQLSTSGLVSSINVNEILGQLVRLQSFADSSNGTRAINTLGFNKTVDYIYNYLRNSTNFIVNRTYFEVRDFALDGIPILLSSINGVLHKNYSYSANTSDADFIHVRYSAPSNFSNVYLLTVIPNGGCTEADWRNASLNVTGRIALVKRGGDCAFSTRAAQAPKFNAAGILFYNDLTNDGNAPFEVSLGQDNALPALFLSNEYGQELADAARNSSINVTVQLDIQVKDLPNFPVGNVCADTRTGNITQTIVIGSHSDSVPAGAGINDNGSGSAANLGLALALYRLFQTSTYEKYKYRIRFCWWGAEEVGLLGAKDHVNKAKISTAPGERLNDYLINLNFDMLGSPNFIFGIYDGRTANANTPNATVSGNNKTTTLFQNWFDQQNLPWDYTDFNGRSDYGPFLAEGIVAGGLFSGADGIKTSEQYNKYNSMLGSELAGTVNITHDPCYHRACDNINNINLFALEKMVKAAAHVLETLARQEDLRAWLYSN